MAVGRQLTTPFVLGTETPGALVGKESREGRDAFRCDAAENLVIEDVQIGESGDASNLFGFSAEIWWKGLNGYPAGADYLFTGPTDTNADFQWFIRLNSTGTITWHADTNPTSPEVTSGAALSADDTTWYHIVGTVDAATSRLYLNGAQVASAVSAGAIYPCTGTAPLSINEGTGEKQYAFDEAAVYRQALGFDRVLAHYQAGRERGYPVQTTGARITAVLNTIGSDAPRNIQAGTRSIAPVFMHGQPPLDEIRRARLAENVDAVFFTARDGTLTFLADGHRSSSPYNTVQATFDDDGTDLPYQDLDLDYSESFLANDWTVTRAAGPANTASDTTSISRYKKRPQTLGDLPVTTDGEAAAIAAALLAKYKDPMTRVQQITLLTVDPDVAEAVFRRDIGDRIRVLRTHPGGGARIDQTLFIQGINIDATPGQPWRIVWNVSPV